MICCSGRGILYRTALKVNAEEEGEEDEENNAEWDDYCGYPFAMEAVNGDIISLTPEMQAEIKDRILKKLDITEEELVSCLFDLSEDEEIDENMRLIGDYEYDFLAEILGFDAEEAEFSQDGIGFLDSSYGWEAKELMERLGFKLHEDIDHGPHDHGTTGVVYCDSIGDTAK